MKDYLLEQWVWVKTHRVKWLLVTVIPIFTIGFWIMVTVPEDPKYSDYLNIYPVIALFVALIVSTVVADLDIRKMRRSGMITAMILSLLFFGSPKTSIARDVRLIGDNVFQVYPDRLEAPFEPVMVEGQMPQVGQAVAACIIAGVAYYIIGCKVVPFCKKNFDKPKNTNSEPELFASGEGGGDSYAAMSCPHSKDCGGGDDLSAYPAEDYSKPNVFEIRGTLVEYGGYPRIKNVRLIKRSSQDVVGFEEWKAGLHELGLGDGYGSGSSFGKNGQPASENEVPIRFGQDGTVIVLSNYETYYVSVERSYDMISWQRLVSIRCAAGNSLSVSDMPDGDHAFYRMVALPP